ncbi:hypothetical protein OPKNFCMD_3877 [Methylobacterium crusticola]|uniref:DNA adenine methylase n=2 Tax=Methylobacterium crusticola TaxID=1697972 RepID=A0ABQ4R2R5_9HYPH|nr:hypothetical protein OPKNFCMD_3877 [Methylobacterium crusticola]
MRAKKPSPIQIGIDVDPEVVARWIADPIAPSCQIICADASEFLEVYPADRHDMVYLDQPYHPEVRSRARTYQHEYNEREHRQLLKVVTSLGGRIMISGYQSGLYDEVLSAWRRVDLAAGTRRVRRVESLWMNFPPSARLHDTRCLGADFRDRTKRRRLSLARRVGALGHNERDAILRWLADAYPEEVAHALGSR